MTANSNQVEFTEPMLRYRISAEKKDGLAPINKGEALKLPLSFTF
jgi:hypothetical protein